MFGDSAGGGFFDDAQNDQPKETTNYNASTSKYSDADKKKPKLFLPMTLKMIKEADCSSDDKFTIGGEELNDVIVIGRVYQKEEHPTRTIYDINDNTATFRVTFYHKEENVLPKYLQDLKFEADCYVKIFGSIRKFKESRSIVGNHATRITEFDAITNHFLQVFVAHETRTKGVLTEDDLQDGEAAQAETDPAKRKSFIEETIMKALEEACKQTGKSNATGDEIFNLVKQKNVKHPEFKTTIDNLVDDMKLFGENNIYSSF